MKLSVITDLSGNIIGTFHPTPAKEGHPTAYIKPQEGHVHHEIIFDKNDYDKTNADKFLIKVKEHLAVHLAKKK